MQLRHPSRADLTQLCVTAMRAFATDPVMRWLHPDDDEFFQHGGEVLRDSMAGWLEYNQVWCTDDCASLAVWLQPGRPGAPDDVDSAGLPASPDLLDRFSIIGPLLAEHSPSEEHWYLQLLATHPDWQRQGLGAALMEAKFAEADQQGLSCHLETETLVNVAYYRRHGFEVHAEFDVPSGRHRHRFSSFGGDPATEVGPHMWGMLRSPR